MKRIKIIAALMMGLAVSACGSSEVATRNAPLDAPEPAAQVQPVAVNVQSVTVSVPRALKVSEANRFYPGGDIVWRGDPRGDRHAQVRKIVQDAMVRGVTGLDTGVPVELYVEVTRFHALTEKARYTTGGVHDLEFRMTLRDPETGAALTEPRLIRADLKAYGGQKAIAAEQRGETQKVRIIDHLASVIHSEIVTPGSHKTADLGVMRLFNKTSG